MRSVRSTKSIKQIATKPASTQSDSSQEEEVKSNKIEKKTVKPIVGLIGSGKTVEISSKAVKARQQRTVNAGKVLDQSK